jgi:hypothetical protein
MSEGVEGGEGGEPPWASFAAPAGRFFARRDAEFAEDLGDVVLGAGEGDAEPGGDLVVRQAFAEEGEDLLLTGR